MNNLAKRLGIILAALGLAAILTLTGCLSGGEASMDSSETVGRGGAGKSGSLARFQVVGDHLYALSGNSLHVYGIKDPTAVTFENSVEVGNGIETLFAQGEALYIGAQTGMHLFDITDRTTPRKTSEVLHQRSCDPVVVQGGIAYVTLRTGGNACWGGKNELQVVNVENPYVPVVLKTYPMANPHGLGIDGDKLFICDGYAGLKVYRLGAGHSLSLFDRVDGVDAYDVIPGLGAGSRLLLVAKEGLYQYDYAETPMRQLSVIKIGG